MDDHFGSAPVVSPGPREKLLEKRQKVQESLRAKLLSAKKDEEENLRRSKSVRTKELYLKYLSFFSEKYFGTSQMFYDLTVDEKDALAEECRVYCYKYIFTHAAAVFAELYVLFFHLIPFSAWFYSVLFPVSIHIFFAFFFLHEISGKKEFDYRLKFPAIYRLYKKLKPPAE